MESLVPGFNEKTHVQLSLPVLQVRDVLWEQIRQFRRSGGAVFLSTHYLEEAEALCDRIGVLHQGSLAGVTRPADGLRLDNGLEVAQFFRQAVEPAPCASP